MAYEDNQTEGALPVPNQSSKRKSSEFLPRYFRTTVNEKFLSSTLDQFIQEGQIEKINSYIGRRTSKATTAIDNFLPDVSKDREDYQLEPATVILDEFKNLEFYKDYNDYVNQLKLFRSNTSNHSTLNQQEYYAWNPSIDWDKFVNFREYYWLPNGPQAIPVFGQANTLSSTYTVEAEDQGDNIAFIFTPDGLTRNANISLYRGQTYRFEVNTPGINLWFRTARTLDAQFNLESVVNNGTDVGVIEFTVGIDTPNIVYYVSGEDINASGYFTISDINENTSINVEAEILGKKEYTLTNGYSLSNGMKVEFIGNVTPEKYSKGYWYVEGVGSAIRLISDVDLEIVSNYTTDLSVPFDSEGFDIFPFSNATGYPINKDYIIINRASSDGNPWSKYNRWFHRNIVEIAAEINGEIANIDQSARAIRPIIEFNAGLKLYKFGTQAKKNVDLIDTFTTDIFSVIEGSTGYYVDGIELSNGMRVLFTADTDIRVNGRIFEVQFIAHNGSNQIALREIDDTDPLVNETVLVTNGVNNKGKSYHYTDNGWMLSQQKTSNNQQPLFEIYNSSDVAYSDVDTFPDTTFSGNKIFSYRVGNGTNDTELGFPITYRIIENVGDTVFDFDLLSSTYRYVLNDDVYYINSDNAYLRVYNGRTSYTRSNAWKKSETLSDQKVIRQYIATTELVNFFTIDVYDKSGDLNDLWYRVYVNNVLQTEFLDFSIFRQDGIAQVLFTNDLSVGDVVQIKTKSATAKNLNGLYEVPHNLERNPLNDNVYSFTLGEVNDHVSTIVEELDTFDGTFPGSSNLRDIGGLTSKGKKFVQHSAPLNLSVYHTTDVNGNIVKAIKFAKKEYGKFKRSFLQIANNLGYDGPIKQHVDKILYELNKDKVKSMPFYFSDMVPMGAATRTEHVVFDEDVTYFALNNYFDLSALSDKAVGVYHNSVQLVFGKDYVFNENGFVNILSPIAMDDIIEIYEYENTNGSYVPPTPTKLGLYPAYEPKIFVDDTYQTPTKVIQGHDGSIVVAWDDFRDELILEVEKRIYNNIKIKYDTTIFDLDQFVSGEYRSAYISVKDLNYTLNADFADWLSLVPNVDYSKNNYVVSNEGFTYNYSRMSSPNGNPLPGYWRAVYKQAFDTDRPHTHPWEMLGFSNMPSWWTDVYGPAPYTRDNLNLWQDLEKGLIREPGVPARKVKTKVRTGLTSYIPVDNQGKLLSPLDSGYAREYSGIYIGYDYIFGDQSPVENAWRKSSEYPFALLNACLVNQPSMVMGVAYDRARIIRDDTGQLIYKPTGRRLRLADIVFPNNATDTARSITAGLVNFIQGYLASQVTSTFDEYKDRVQRIENRISAKLGGFTNKDNFNLILDSRTPLNKGNVFVPKENYNIYLNTSSPIDAINYSAVIIERIASGFKITGYDKTESIFRYNRVIETNTDVPIRVGGISESYVEWEPNTTLSLDKIVKWKNSYYRVIQRHTSGNSFDIGYYVKLAELPTTGGQAAFFRKRFSSEFLELPYGTVLKTVQDVVDFLLGYGNYLTSKGFIFEYFNSSTGVLENWEITCKEFLFWVTQNWATGSIIAVSPCANQLSFSRNYSVVDNIFNPFYDYSLLNSDGTKLLANFSNIARTTDNNFTLATDKNDSNYGIFNVKIHLVQKEHVLVLDNVSDFKDIIYQPTTGYRQEKIKILGYRTSDWKGSLDVPGFVYDDAKITLWKAWKDYSIGEVVKYKQFYYSADNFVAGTQEFNANNWVLLPEKPNSQIFANWDYKVNQFADFYDLDTDNFDAEQQKLGQHLIGYQKRQYLENIINDEVSQYKFYQGFIQDKGTKNSLTKLFDALGSADKDSIEFYEEWAIRTGQYGALEKFDQVEFIIDESKARIEPIVVELTDTIPLNSTDLAIRQRPSDVYLKPTDYTSNSVFPSKYLTKEFTKTAGHVLIDETTGVIYNRDVLLNLSPSDINLGDYIWVSHDNNSWTVLKAERSAVTIVGTDLANNEAEITCSGLVPFAIGDTVGILNTANDVNGIVKVTNVIGNKFYFETDTSVARRTLSIHGIIYEFVEHRVSTTDNINSRTDRNRLKQSETFWIDSDSNGYWKVLQNNPAYNTSRVISNITETTDQYGSSFDVNDRDTLLVVGTPSTTDGGVVHTYTRGATNQEWTYRETINVTGEISETSEGADGSSFAAFGQVVSLSPDGQYLAVGIPDASNVKVLSGTNEVSTSGILSGLSEQGMVAFYSKRSNNTFLLEKIVVSDDPQTNERFGGKIEWRKVNGTWNIFVSASDKIYLINKDSSNDFTYPTTSVVYDGAFQSFNVSASGHILIVGSTEVVYVYRLLDTDYVLDQTILAPVANENYAQSVSINTDGTMIAIGAPKSDTTSIDAGKVYIYKFNNEFVLEQTLTSPIEDSNEQFGYNVEFDKDVLAVASMLGDQVRYLTMTDGTLFDDGYTRIIDETFKDTGEIYLFENIDGFMIYSENLDYFDAGLRTFGKRIKVTDSHVYVGLPTLNYGAIIDFSKTPNAFAWNTIRSQQEIVDTDKIKQVFLYDKANNVLLDRIDFVDPVNGKILGVAEQELSFKTFYDPAVYNVGTDGVTVDSGTAWSTNYVGKLWWDLSRVKWLNATQESDAVNKAKNWNTLVFGASVDIYEWVSSSIPPSEWAAQADTDKGLAKGYSGQPKYDDTVYSYSRVYDPKSRTFTPKYYFWVRNKRTVPANDLSRAISASQVASLIRNPANEGYRYVALLSPNEFAIYNCKGLLSGNNTVLHIDYYTDDNSENNIHSQYQILAKGLDTSKPNVEIESKWFDSLIGYDRFLRAVPDLNLPINQRYGTQFKPRQSWFINKIEARKQFFERVNRTLLQNIIVDDFDTSDLHRVDPIPSIVTNLWDTQVDVETELRFVNIGSVRPAVLQPVVENGTIVSVIVLDVGNGYITAPTIDVNGSGNGAELESVLVDGKVSAVTVKNGGTNYSDTVRLEVRPFTVLVNSDSTIQGKWALYKWSEEFGWERSVTQSYNVTLYWDYTNWYADGYSEITSIDHLVGQSYELASLDDNKGDIVKIQNVGTGGWLLLRKIDSQTDVDYTINYETIGRQNGTLQFNSKLYNYLEQNIGYGADNYDTRVYDREPIRELRIILETIRDKIFVDNLAVYYNELFFASLRYVFHEQQYVDWAFKTSFLKAKHNVGELSQKVTFQNDNLPSYEEYIKEVKPFKTKIREYISAYEKTDYAYNVVTDFDLSPRYVDNRGKIITDQVKVLDNEIYGNGNFDTYPAKNWLDNVGYSVIKINIKDAGTNWTQAPVVTLSGGGGTGATAKAYVSGGRISEIKITNPGTGYFSAPTVTLNGSQREGGKPAKVYAVIGDGLVRTTHMIVKFDRITGAFLISTVDETETFTGNGSQTTFGLLWPMNVKNDTVEVEVDGVPALYSDYSFGNVTVPNSVITNYLPSDFSGTGTNQYKEGHTKQKGYLTFVNAPVPGAVIRISYKKAVTMMSAADRINNFYNPTTGMLGNDLAQLMEGIDYGGVEVKGLELGSRALAGWGTGDWFTGGWDVYDESFDDEIFILDDSTLSFELSAPLVTGVEYNVYKRSNDITDPNYHKDIRLDDPNFGTAQQTNTNAIMATLLGDGTTTTVILPSQPFDNPQAGDEVIIRRSTSDGSYLPDANSYDTQLSGGDLAYSTAKGINAEDIIVDGDGFITATNAKGPEELVPGQVNDTVDIKVYHRPTDGSSIISNRIYATDGATTTYAMGIAPVSESALFVKLDNVKVNPADFTVDYANKTLTFTVAPPAEKTLSIVAMSANGSQILDIDSTLADGSTEEFITNATWVDGCTIYVTVNGVEFTDVVAFETDNTYPIPGLVGLNFDTAPQSGDLINYSIFASTSSNYSKITIDTLTGDGSTTTFALSQAPYNSAPSTFNVLVKVDNTFLNAGYNKEFAVTTAVRDYQIDTWQKPNWSLGSADIEVYLNKVKLDPSTEFLWVSSESKITLQEGIGTDGDELEFYAVNDGEYKIIDNTVVFDIAPPVDAAIEVYQFSNDEINEFERQSFSVVERTPLTIGTEAFTAHAELELGIITLRKPAISADYVWVIKNGVLLTPNADYELLSDMRSIKLYVQPIENDVIETLEFAASKIIEKFGYRIFKDMLNRVHYKRLDSEGNYVLAKALNWNDDNITLVDGTGLTQPNKHLNLPGVVFINGERIEYFIKQGRLLRQLRRGTLGTGVPQVHPAGTEVMDQGFQQTVPYKDETIISTYEVLEGEFQTEFDLDFTPISINEFEVFVAGKRLRKNEIEVFDPSVAIDSPEGDSTLPAEFTIDGATLIVSITADADYIAQLTTNKYQVKVIRKVGKLWTEPGESLTDANNKIAKFLRDKSVALPK